MKETFVTIILLFASLYISVAQNHPYTVKFSHQIEADVAEGKITPTRAGLLYSLIGSYHTSNEYSDIPVSWGVDTINIENHNTSDALIKITKAAKDRQIVIISENHLKPQHRLFADKIITELAKKGFNHLGLETFSSLSNSTILLDSTISSRGYPLDSPLTGTYTLEPQMGKLVRHAIELNINLFAYERSQKIKDKDRDEIQADNIIKYLNKNPKSKLIIICGFYHAIESDIQKRGNAYWMAKYLKDKTGIDPLTIYQDNFTEKFIEQQHPILSKVNIEDPSVLVDDQGELIQLTHNVDIEIIHPTTYYIYGRPHWLFKNTNNKAVKINLAFDNLDFPIIISAYPINEIKSVPVDRVEIKHMQDDKSLALSPGLYRITVFDGLTTHEYTETVK